LIREKSQKVGNHLQRKMKKMEKKKKTSKNKKKMEKVRTLKKKSNIIPNHLFLKD